MSTIGKMIAANAALTIRNGEALLKDVSPSVFARQPRLDGKLINCNHPAWVYGHLASYCGKVSELLGKPAKAGELSFPESWNDLFKNGSVCTDDPEGKIYPKMDALTSSFLKGYNHILKLLPEVSDEYFSKPNPMPGRLAEMLPTIGAAAQFLTSGHPMSHLGQVSTWRRCMGLGSAF